MKHVPDKAAILRDAREDGDRVCHSAPSGASLREMDEGKRKNTNGKKADITQNANLRSDSLISSYRCCTYTQTAVSVSVGV